MPTLKSAARQHRERRLQRALVAALVLFAVLAQGAYFANMLRWQHAPDRGWAFIVQLGPRVVALVRPLGEEAGLRKGDVILRLNGASYETFQELWDLLDYEIGSVNTYEIERGDEVKTVVVENRPLGLGRVLAQSGVFWTLGMLITGLGFLVFAMKPFHGPSWAFMAMSVLLGVIIPHYAPAHTVFWPAALGNMVILGAPLIPATVLVLAALFPQRKSAILERRRWLGLAFGISVGLAVVSGVQASYVGDVPAPVLTTIYLYWLVSVLAFLGGTAYDYFRTKFVAVRLQSTVIFTGLTLAFLLPVIELVSNLVLRVSIFPNLVLVYGVCLLFFPLSIGYAIARHDLFEISTIVRRTYGYILSSAAVIGAYSVLLSLLNLTAFAEVTESRAFSISMLLLIAFTFEPVHRRSQGFVDRVFFRQRYDYRKTIREVSEAMSTILDPGDIHHKLLETLVEEMQLENGILMLLEPGVEKFRPELVLGGGRPLGVASIPLEDPLVGHLERAQNPLFRHDVDLNPRLETHRSEMQQRFTTLHAEVAIAMKYQAQLVGLISLGQKKSGRMFTLEDLDLLQTMTNQTAIALQNARLFDDLAESLKQVQMLESVKSSLAKFVPQTVQDMIEEAPDAAGIFEKQEMDLTVMFADMTGYTRMSAQLPLDEVNAIVERYFGAFLDEILKRGGDVNETAGDGLMVLFQDQDPERHARAAVGAAVAIQRLTRELNTAREGQLPIGMHIGINSGNASVGATKIQGGAGSRWTYTASGPTTNIAARVGALGEEIAVTEETHRRLGSAFVTEEVGPRELKNVKEPVRVYRVVGAGALDADAVARRGRSSLGAENRAAREQRQSTGSRKFLITGLVTEQGSRRPLVELQVRAYDRDVVSDDYLGSAITDSGGGFEITFTEDLFSGPFEQQPDVYIRIFEAGGERELYSTHQAVRWEAESPVHFDIAIPGARLTAPRA